MSLLLPAFTSPHSRDLAITGATIGHLVRVPSRATVWRTGPVTGRCVRGAACCRRRAGSGNSAEARRQGGTARAGERLGVRPVALWLAPAAEAESVTAPGS